MFNKDQNKQKQILSINFTVRKRTCFISSTSSASYREILVHRYREIEHQSIYSHISETTTLTQSCNVHYSRCPHLRCKGKYSRITEQSIVHGFANYHEVIHSLSPAPPYLIASVFPEVGHYRNAPPLVPIHLKASRPPRYTVHLLPVREKLVYCHQKTYPCQSRSPP